MQLLGPQANGLDSEHRALTYVGEAASTSRAAAPLHRGACVGLPSVHDGDPHYIGCALPLSLFCA
jgi:hypothetical protein